jgi:DNA-binding transcriptional LysR family regulator
VNVIPPMLASLGDRYPAIRIELDLNNAEADLLEQQVDIAVRMFPPKQMALVAKKVPAISIGFYAAADYLAQHGTPTTLQDLMQHRLIGPDRSRADLAVAARIFPAVNRQTFALSTDSHPAALAAARAGVGVAVVQCHVGDKDDRLRRVVPDFDVASLDTWIVTHENLRDVPRVRAVFDHLVQGFSGLAAPTENADRG